MERREDRRIGKTGKTDKTGVFGSGKEKRKSLDAAPDREEQAAKIFRLEFLIRRISGILVSDRAETENGSAASAVIGGRGYTEGEFSDIVYYAETLKRIFGEESGRGEEAADVPEVPDIPEEWAEMLGKVVCGIWRGKIWTGDMVGKMSGGGKGENSLRIVSGDTEKVFVKTGGGKSFFAPSRFFRLQSLTKGGICSIINTE